MAGQIARIAGCRVIGIAGTDDKCRLIRDEFGFHGAINYKTESVSDRLENLVDAYSKLFEGRNIGKVVVSV